MIKDPCTQSGHWGVSFVALSKPGQQEDEPQFTTSIRLSANRIRISKDIKGGSYPPLVCAVLPLCPIILTSSSLFLDLAPTKTSTMPPNLYFDCGTCGKSFPAGSAARENHLRSTGHSMPANEMVRDRASPRPAHARHRSLFERLLEFE